MYPLLKVPVALARACGSSVRTVRNRVPEYQKLFQEDNGLPVHIKGGKFDVFLYRVTMALTVTGGFYSVYWLIVATLPQKNKG